LQPGIIIASALVNTKNAIIGILNTTTKGSIVDSAKKKSESLDDEDIFYQLGRAKYSSCIDLMFGFHQVNEDIYLGHKYTNRGILPNDFKADVTKNYPNKT